MKFCTIVGLALISIAISAQQQSNGWRPNLADINKSASLEETMDFILSTEHDPSLSQYVTYWDGAEHKGHQVYSLFEVNGAESQARCGMTWTEVQVNGIALQDTWRRDVSLDLSKLDPLSVVVKTAVFEDGHSSSGFLISMSGTSNKPLSHYSALYIGDQRVWRSVSEVEQYACTKKDKDCHTDTGDTAHAQLFVTDEEVSHRMARALVHAALLCGGTKAVSPF
jgi:hypothetical protein